MSQFEKMIEKLKENNTVPENVRMQFQNTLEGLPEQKKGIQWKRYAAVAAMLAMCSGVVLMGGTALASKIPFLGRIFAEVENLHFFPGDYDDKAQIVEKTENTEAANQGIKITASEIYSDGFSVYVTAEIVVEEGGLNNIPGGISRQNMYLMGSYQLEGDDNVYEMENDNLYGKVVDDHTFIGMTKLDLDDVCVEDGVLNWNLSTIGYDDVSISEENGIAHRIEGQWNISLPFDRDAENTKTIEVNHSENGYTLERVVVTPYQMIAFWELPEEWVESYVVAFDQDGKKLEWHGALESKGSELVANFSLHELDVNALKLYVFDDMDLWLEVYKSADMNHESIKAAVVSAEVTIE